MQTILGAGGAIATELAKSLVQFDREIRLVSRHPKKVNEGDMLFTADLVDSQSVNNAVKGSDVVYLTAGLPYNTKTWQEQWPVIARNVIDACVAHGCRLVFFDNVYLYDVNSLSPMLETNLVNPPSRKGKVRAEVIEMIWKDTRQQGLRALVARSADFYGRALDKVSVLTGTVVKPLTDKKTANWLVDATKKHSFTFTPDAGKATALLGVNDDAYGDTWHLPTASDPMTGREWVEAIAGELGVAPKFRTIGKGMIRMMGLFVPAMKESYEMLYQFEKEYVFNSDKFEKRFGVRPTPYKDGIAQMLGRS